MALMYGHNTARLVHPALGLLVLCLLFLSQQAVAKLPTHQCELYVNGTDQVISLSCSTTASAASSCKLTVYCHDMGGFTCSTAKSNMSLARLPAANDSRNPLNRTDETMLMFKSNDGQERTSRLVMTPLLYFYGGPNCHVILRDAKIENVDLRIAPDPKDSTQVLMFGGGSQQNGWRAHCSATTLPQWE